MGRRDADGRPPIEILGADLGIGSTQQVALGPRRPKPGRGRSLASCSASSALLGAGWCSAAATTTDGGGPQEERDNQERIDLDKPLTSTTESGDHDHPPVHHHDPSGRPALRGARGGCAARHDRRQLDEVDLDHR